MTERRFTPHDPVVVIGPTEGQHVEYRWRHGKKGPDDVVTEWRHVGGWEPVVLDHAFLHIDSIADNEEVLYPHGRGGSYVWDFIRLVGNKGWRPAVHRLHLERGRRQERLDDKERRLEGA
jgi:hypothetical protein